MSEHLFHSPEETEAFGVSFGKSLTPNTILCLHGDLAAGKTTLVKGIARGAANVFAEAVHSPTFVYLHIYEGEKTVYHFDLYRLQDGEEFLKMGFEEMLFAGGIACIEWPERIGSFLPSQKIDLYLTHVGEGVRRLTIDGHL